jgi:hypothetical protein
MDKLEDSQVGKLLAEVGKYYQEPIPVWVGKIVTIADFDGVDGAGLPYVVIEIDGDCMIGPGGKRAYASIRSVRIACVTRDDTILHEWVEPGMLREYVEENEEA